MASEAKDDQELSNIGLYGLAVMGQNLALNIASKGFRISVCNRDPTKVDRTVARAKEEGNLPLIGFKDVEEFVKSIESPRKIILLVKAGKPVDMVIAAIAEHLDAGDLIVDGGNEWYPNTLRRGEELQEKGIRFMGMGVSGGEEGARNGPSLMPGSSREAYEMMEPIITKIAAQVDDGPCVTYVGELGAGNYVKMVHNGIEYGDMELITEAYDILKTVGNMTNEELGKVFTEWNSTELESFLIEITATIFTKKDEDGTSYVLDNILDKAGNKGTGKWTSKEACERSVPAPTIIAALEARYMSALKDDRVAASKVISGPTEMPEVDRAQLIDDMRQALYAAKICSYAQGMNLIKQCAQEEKWTVNLGECARIWKGGCIIRAKFLDRIKAAYDRNPDLTSLLMDPEFAAEVNARQLSWRRIVTLACAVGIPVPAFSASLYYLDSIRRARGPLNMIQAQRDFFGAHTYMRVDGSGPHHTEWAKQDKK